MIGTGIPNFPLMVAALRTTLQYKPSTRSQDNYTHRTYTSAVMRSKTPYGMISNELVAPWVSRTLSKVPELAVPRMGTTTGVVKVWSKIA